MNTRCSKCLRPMAGNTAYDGACECGGLIETTETVELEIGRVYRGKRPAYVRGFVNDRQVLALGSTTVQYDSPSIRFGRRYPIVDREKFEKWVGRDVTDELPDGEWQDYFDYRKAKRSASSDDTK